MSNIYYRGDTLFLYVQFKDENKNIINVTNPVVKIIHEKNGETIVDLEWFELIKFSENEYYANFVLNNDADYGLYEIVYAAEYNNKVARVVEDFHVIPKSNVYENTVKIYGYVNQARVGYPLISASVKVSLPDESEVISESFTKENGYWEAFVYPGEYKFEFKKNGFISDFVYAQVGLEHNEIQFNNISLESESSIKKGNGVYLVTDKYITREGMAIVGLTVKAFSIFNPSFCVAEDKTNEKGEWEIFLDPGNYLLKVTGNIYKEEFDQTFRLKVEDNGNFSFENLTQNVAIPVEENDIDRGNGSVVVTDEVLDANGNAIIDVMVSVFRKNDLNVVIAQDYTDVTGKWEVYLDPGSYIIEYYHPEFHVITEERVVS